LTIRSPERRSAGNIGDDAHNRRDQPGSKRPGQPAQQDERIRRPGQQVPGESDHEHRQGPQHQGTPADAVCQRAHERRSQGASEGVRQGTQSQGFYPGAEIAKTPGEQGHDDHKTGHLQAHANRQRQDHAAGAHGERDALFYRGEIHSPILPDLHQEPVQKSVFSLL
jgi:hypothetical protein